MVSPTFYPNDFAFLSLFYLTGGMAAQEHKTADFGDFAAKISCFYLFSHY